MLIICMLIVTIIHSMQRNNFLLQTQKDNTSVFWRKKTNNRKLDLTRQSPHQNPVYRVLKNQRDSNTILAFILGQGETKSPSKHMRSQSYEVQRYRSNSKQLKEKETFREKAVDIMFKATRMSQEMEGSRKRFKILNKFNKTVEKYYSNRTEGEEDDAALAQSIMANNDELMKMYNEQNYLSLSLKKRASSCIKYTQPRIPRDKIRKLKQKVRIILNVTPKSKNSTATKPLIATTNDP